MINLLVSAIAPLLDKVIPDKDQAVKLAHEIATMTERHAQELAKAQIEVNKAEAAHKSLFVAGWRPAIGWICALGMLCNYIVLPIASIGLSIAGINVVIQPLDLSEMMPVLLGMLGLGGLRTWEKHKGVARER